jgi:hypothetical protein
VTVYQRIARAARRGAGLRLTADEVGRLSRDHAVACAAENDDLADEDPDREREFDEALVRQRFPNSRLVTVYQKIVRAVRRGAGLRLTADEVGRLCEFEEAVVRQSFPNSRFVIVYQKIVRAARRGAGLRLSVNEVGQLCEFEEAVVRQRFPNSRLNSGERQLRRGCARVEAEKEK